MIYLGIFIAKVLENALATLRIIVVSNGKKKLGAFLQGLVALVWVLVTGIVIIDVNKDVFKIICFVIGSIVGSYLGSIIEEKIALGTNLLIINTTNIKETLPILNSYQPFIYQNYILFKIKRKKSKDIIKKISAVDDNCVIISSRIKINYDKLTT